MKKKIILTLSKRFPLCHTRKGEPTHFREELNNTLNDCQETVSELDGAVVRERKIHTIRANFARWKHNISKIDGGGFYLSVRQWSAKPYRSPQEVITEIPADIVGVQRLALRRECRVINHYAEEQDKPIATAMYYDYTAEVDGHPVPLEILAENDGLTVDDFKAWFAPVFAEADKKYPQFTGLASAVTIDFAIIHFTKRRY